MLNARCLISFRLAAGSRFTLQDGCVVWTYQSLFVVAMNCDDAGPDDELD